jgi:hypothetical protein
LGNIYCDGEFAKKIIAFCVSSEFVAEQLSSLQGLWSVIILKLFSPLRSAGICSNLAAVIDVAL